MEWWSRRGWWDFTWLDGSLRPLIVAGGGGGQAVTGHRMKGFGGDGSLKERGTMGPYIKKHMLFQIQQMFRIILV